MFFSKKERERERERERKKKHICGGEVYGSEQARTFCSGGGSSKILKGTGTKILGLRGVKLIGFGPFVYCLWGILLLFFTFLSFLYFALFSCPIFLPPWNFKGERPPLKVLVGTGTSPSPRFRRLCKFAHLSANTKLYVRNSQKHPVLSETVFRKYIITIRIINHATFTLITDQ